MEYILMTFAELIALQTIVDKDEEKEPVLTKKTGGHRKTTNKGERASQKKAKAKKKAKTFNFSVDDLSRKVYKLAAKSNHYDKDGVYNHLCREEAASRAERQIARYEENASDGISLEKAKAIREELENTQINLGYAKDMVEWAEAHHEELNNQLNWLNYESAEGLSVREAYDKYLSKMKERDDFIPTLRTWRREYNDAIYAYNKAKAAYDMLPFWA